MTDEGKPVTLSDAVMKHYAAESDKRRKVTEDELRKFEPDERMDALVERLDVLKQNDPAIGRGAVAQRFESYRRRRDAALAFQATDDNSGDDAA